MSEYIEREAAIAVVQGGIEFEEETKGNGVRTLVIVQKGIERLPAADVAPVVRGEWKYDKRISAHCCDKCKFPAPNYVNGEEMLSGFCPYCGARMKEESTNG